MGYGKKNMRFVQARVERIHEASCSLRGYLVANESSSQASQVYSFSSYIYLWHQHGASRLYTETELRRVRVLHLGDGEAFSRMQCIPPSPKPIYQHEQPSITEQQPSNRQL